MHHSIGRAPRAIIAIILVVSGMLATGPGVALATHFNDVPPSHPFYADIEWLAGQNITTGCGGGRYCPDDAVPREQMASFLVRALGLPPSSGDTFADDNDSQHEADIQALVAASITAGCGGVNFCPHNPVTREQMASFLVRGYHLDPSDEDTFADDDNSQHEYDIEALVASSITQGCGGPNFCPSASVTRGQMAAFLHRAAPYLAPNQTPNAINDIVTITTTCQWQYRVLTNDTDPDNSQLGLRITAVTQPANGTTTILTHQVGGTQVNRVVSYRSNAGFIGVDTFTYTVSDLEGATDTATVTMNVNAASGDTDADGIVNECDPFFIQASSNPGIAAPFALTFDGTAGGNWQAAGFQGLLTNSRTNPNNLIDADVVLNGTGRFVDPTVADGDAFGANDNQRNAFDVRVVIPAGNFTIHGIVCAPYPPAEFSSIGIFFGPGNQDNLIKAVVDVKNGGPAVHDMREVNGSARGISIKADPNISSVPCVDLYLIVDKGAGTYTPKYSLNGGATTLGFFPGIGGRVVPAAWLDGSQPLAVGIIATSQGPSTEYLGSWELLEVTTP